MEREVGRFSAVRQSKIKVIFTTWGNSRPQFLENRKFSDKWHIFRRRLWTAAVLYPQLFGWMRLVGVSWYLPISAVISLYPESWNHPSSPEPAALATHRNCVWYSRALPVGRMIQFSLFNIPIRVLPWFWLTLAILGMGGGADSKEAILGILLFMLAGFISILVHELGHALTAKHYGKYVEIVLQAFGGYAAYSGGGRLSRFQTMLITAAGPAVQILLGIAALVLVIQVEGLSPHAKYFFTILCWISFVWAILNLLPILPMDGGRLLETMLGPERIRLTLQISLSVAVLIAVLALIFKLGILLPLFMGMMAYESYKALKGISW